MKLTFESSDEAFDNATNEQVYWFDFAVEDAPAERLIVRVGRIVRSRIFPDQPRPNLEQFTGPLTMLALSRIEAVGAERLDSLMPRTFRDPTVVIDLQEADIPEVRRLATGKHCKYQLPKQGDLYCAASVPLRGGSPVVGPTTRHLCGGCSMPDSRLVCSHLHHATVLHGNASFPALSGARCDLGRNEIEKPSACHPAGNACWEREVEFAPATSSVPSPLALHDAFDYFDSLWKNVFRAHILRVRGAAVAGKLATTCTSQADFEVKLSALADIINSLDVADEDLAPEHRESKNHVKGRTLARVESAMAHRLTKAGADAESVERVKAAVRVLRDAMDLRVGYQHTGGDAAGKLPQALARFGVTYPPASGEAAWGRVQERVLGALTGLRSVLRDLD
jgi:hypothetical protein